MKYLKWYLYYAAIGTVAEVASFYAPAINTSVQTFNLANPVGKLIGNAIANALGKT